MNYKHLRFLEADEDDNELGAGPAYAGLSTVKPGVDYYYSNGSKGSFLELYLRGEITASEGRITLEPYVKEGFDFSYATEAHDGPNNFQIGVDISLSLNDRFSITGYLARSWPLKDVDRENLGGLTWAGLGVSAEF